ncbi:uncharacterized protein LOC128252981 [Drosophila gunungcola]|uniref:TIL domain-containing protein n=1 Tax=Drosophila gunungcola TaxID=103775 RepID=A0A9P9YX21_9MUSC|nr:uncharacterized protein LOC128252981 [Drosophila gunungcola]KAI8044264.1 hypothetical protein M5D96_000415 [Drosophila gunungcola]
MLYHQITLGLMQLFLLLGASATFPRSEPCGEHEERACLPCTEPKCSHPYIQEPLCAFFKKCHLGCGCKFGYVRHDFNNRCISALECRRPVHQLPIPFI